MSLEQLEENVRALPPRELARFVVWLDGYLGRAIAHDETSAVEELSDVEQAELLRRRSEIVANPALARPMDDEYFERLKRELAHARAERASGG